MEPDEEPEPGSSSQNQNLQDLQSYLVTFNKDIGNGDDVLHNMDVDTSVGDVSDLYGTTSENPLQESGDAGVSSQFSSGFYSEQGMLGTTLSDESTHPIQNLVGPVGTDGDSEMSEIKQEVNSMNLEGVTAQIAGFEDAHLTHAIPGIQASSLSQGLIMAPLGDSIMTNQGKVLSIVSLGGEEGQFLSLADGQQMQIINSEDLGLTADGLDTGEGSLDIASTSSMMRSSNADSPIPLSSLSTSVGDITHTSGITITPVQNSGNLITTTAATGATLLNPGLGQLVSLQGAGEGGQPQLVSLQGDAIQSDALQIQGLLGAEAINSDLAYQTITIMPSDLSQNGEMNYVLILSQPEGEKETVGSMAQVYDLKQENPDFGDEMMDENGDVKRVVRFVPKKMVTQLGNQQLMCAFCNYTSPKRYLLTRHMRSHSDERPFKCESCDRGFKTSASLLNHVNTHTGTRPHKCKTCEAAFTTSGELVRHIRYRHTFEKPHRCPECDYASVELSKLKRHMRSHTGERPYKCPNCPYASPDTYKLKRHMRIHTGEKPYECDHCHARFTQSNSLKAHKLIHTGNKPVYQCSLCPTTCGRKTDLKIHFNKLHSAGLPLECRKCGKTYSDRYSYKQHLRTHDVDKCYKCEHCNFIAANEKSLEAHTVVHCGKHRCDECSTTFSSQKQFDKHIALLHPNGQARRKLDGDDKDFHGNLESSLPKEGQIGHLDESGGSQVVITPLASDTLHKNLIQDIKEGKLGDVPQVVIVHPDGSQEEISSKFASDRWNVEDGFPSLPTSDVSTRVENILNDKAPEMPMAVSLSANSIVSISAGDALLSAASREDNPPESLGCQEDDLQSQNESSQHCEAATQVEIESDADSSSDTASFDCGKGNNKENPAQQLGKDLQDSISSLVDLDSSGKNSLIISDLTQLQVLKPPTSSSPLYVKTLINTSSGKKSITSLASTQAQSFPSVVRVTQTSARPHASTGSSRSHQYSLLNSSVTCVNNDSKNSAKTPHPLCNDKNSGPKVFVSLSGLCGDSSQPPVQLLAGDLNLASSILSEGGHNDSIQGLELGEIQSTSNLSHGHMDLETVDNSNSEVKETQEGCEETIAMPDDQRIKNNLSITLGDNNSSSSTSDQSAIQNVIYQHLSLSSENTSTGLDLAKEQTEEVNQQMSPLAFVHIKESFKEQDLGSSADQTCGVRLNQEPHTYRGHDAISDVGSAIEPQLVSPSKPSTDQDVSSTKNLSSQLTSSETNLCDNPNELAQPISVCPESKPHSIPSKEAAGSDNENGLVSENSASSCGPDTPKQSHKPFASDVVDVVSSAEGPKDVVPAPKSKSTKGRFSKRRAETDQALVMTGKRLRKALVKVSL